MEKNIVDDGRTYFPQIFDSPTIESAKQIIVTSEPNGGITSEERWVKETPFLVDEIGRYFQLDDGYGAPGNGELKVILDYGCGIGRIAKGLIDKFNCRVVGIDFNQSMRLHAPEYVLSDKFVVWSPETLAKMIEIGFRVDHAFSVWVIQHILYPTEALNLINNVLNPGGLLYSLNSTRCVPTDKGFTNDAVSVEEESRKLFDELELRGDYFPATVASPELNAVSVLQILRKRE